MKKMTLTLLVYLFTFTAEAKLIPSEILFSQPEFSMAQLAPSGKYLSITEKGDKGVKIVIVDSKTFETYVAASFHKQQKLTNYVWLNDSQIYIQISQNNKRFEYIYDFTFKQTSKENKFNLIKNGYIVNWLPDEPEKVLFTKKNNKNRHVLYKVALNDLKNNNLKNAAILDISERNIGDYFFDVRFKRIVTTEVEPETNDIILKWRPLKSKKWQTLLTFKDKDYQFTPVGFISEDLLAVLSNKDTDKVVLHEFNIKTQKLGKILFQHQKYDLANAELDDNGTLQSVHYYKHGLYTKQYFDPQNKNFSARLSKTFQGKTAFIIDSSLDGSVNLIYTVSSDHPGRFLLYDNTKDKLQSIEYSYPKLEDYAFAKTEHINIKGADGTSLEAFLTKPNTGSLDHKTLLVMPHGGPIGVQEIDYFSAKIQYLVNQGFSILRVNFRGSAGFGKAFLEQGVGQFGKLIEQDITSAVDHVTTQYKFNHMCSMGSSYGGYSSVMLAMKYPSKYQCVVAAYGIYDLPLLFNESNYRASDEFRKNIASVVGELNESHISSSPVYMTDKLQSPILLIAGTDDNIATIEHTNRFNYVLQKHNKNIERIDYQRTGHGHSTLWGARHEALSVVDFLYKTLALPRPMPDNLSEKESSAVAEDYALLADSYNFEYRVEKNIKKAHEYYTSAAKYKHSRSLFNLGAYYHQGNIVEKSFAKALKYYKESATQDYAGAHQRLGRLYMEGEEVTQDFDQAFMHLTKAVELDKSDENQMRLGRFYCIANKKYQDLTKCIDSFKFTDKSRKEWKNINKFKKVEYAKIFTDGSYTQKELQRLQEMIITDYELTNLNVTIEVEESGIFHFQESNKFGESGMNELVNDGNSASYQKGIDASYGLYFSTDLPGMASYKDNTALIVKWSKIDKTGSSETLSNRILWGNTKGSWFSTRNITNKDEAGNYQLEIFDLNKRELYQRKFTIN
ncbi:prolyl oligopeptidase family serine peptidase [Litorilituus lipolyticus]|uniref:Peptidase S9 prolyl oligopeptidase catalytic domain-containing protein n=1 Tax=Litorilituus lipolyticus TaxID=2491017 RepID=A0A502KX13_9GAMM|nr:prolyl oligopeptidase family serine peptidase [Litorilituus lipolyticus]TPH16198.1 hypothetical protein EPA86_07215 [Litorilituus lipolyticus]